MSQRRVLGLAMADHCTGIGGAAGMPSIFRRSTSVQVVLDEGRHHAGMADTGFLILPVRGVAFTLQQRKHFVRNNSLDSNVDRNA